jgi:hypothetical protein
MKMGMGWQKKDEFRGAHRYMEFKKREGEI